MPNGPSYPGVYVKELPRTPATIAGVDTSVTAFIGRAAQGPVDTPVRVTSFAEYEQVFGTSPAADALSAELTLPRAIARYFQHGGAVAVVVRVANTTDEGASETALSDAQISDSALREERRGLWALEDVDIFNLLYIPPLSPTVDIADSTRVAATRYCRDRRAIHLLDPPRQWSTAYEAEVGVDDLRSKIGSAAISHAAIYFPGMRIHDPLVANQVIPGGPGAAVAGIIARTDNTRGVWKSPAGLSATLLDMSDFTAAITRAETHVLNGQGVNMLRHFPSRGALVWGARTLAGANNIASEWKHLPVRRMALFIEESILRGTRWAVFEPNDEPLWKALRTSIDGFMQGLFRQGAFQGARTSEAFFVKCDRQTMTQKDIQRGVVNIEVGFAPLKPAEFVIIRIQQRQAST